MSTLTEADLSQFTGSDQWTRHSLCRNVIYSQGMEFVAEKAGAHWLIDAIASHEAANPKMKRECAADEDFNYLHFWTLTVDLQQHTAILSCRKDSNLPLVVKQVIEYTDFPLSEIKVYAGTDGPGQPRKLYLPSEY